VKNLKLLRKQRKLSQQELAKQLLISQQTVCKYENNTLLAPEDIVVKTALFFGVSTDYLLGLSDTTEPIWEAAYEAACSSEEPPFLKEPQENNDSEHIKEFHSEDDKETKEKKLLYSHVREYLHATTEERHAVDVLLKGCNH